MTLSDMVLEAVTCDDRADTRELRAIGSTYKKPSSKRTCAAADGVHDLSVL